VEFHRIRARVVDELDVEYEKILTAVDTLRSASTSWAKQKKFESSAKAVNDLVRCVTDKLKQEIKTRQGADPHRVELRNDPVLARLEGLTNARIGRRPTSKQLAQRVRDFVDVRAPSRIPPGFADVSKIDSAGETAGAGDYLIWCEILKIARASSRDVLFVSNDAKSDWWKEGKSLGLPNLPHPLLIDELKRETGKQYFQLKPHELMRRARSALNVNVTDDTITAAAELDQAAAAATHLGAGLGAFQQALNYQSTAWAAALASAADEVSTLQAAVLASSRYPATGLGLVAAAMDSISSTATARGGLSQYSPEDWQQMRDISKNLEHYSRYGDVNRDVDN
jgi:hypothetical protein